MGMGAEHAEERLAFDITNPWWGEHVARYHYAASFVKGKRVLDVACGTGFGLEILAAHCDLLVGVDRDEKTLSEVRERILPPTQLIAADACKLPFPDSFFDVAVSFETLEHLSDRSGFVQELARVVAPMGVVILSTPNALVTHPKNGKPYNPHHLYEYTPSELSQMLLAEFGEVTLFGQVVDPRFVIPPFSDLQKQMPPTPWNRLGATIRRLLYRMPASMRDRVSRALWHHTFFPQKTDFQFSRERVDDAAVLLAVCRAKSGRTNA